MSERLAHKPEIKGLNPAIGSGRERKWQMGARDLVAQWQKTQLVISRSRVRTHPLNFEIERCIKKFVNTTPPLFSIRNELNQFIYQIMIYNDCFFFLSFQCCIPINTVVTFDRKARLPMRFFHPLNSLVVVRKRWLILWSTIWSFSNFVKHAMKKL